MKSESRNITNSWPFPGLPFLGLSTLEKFKIILEQIFLTLGQNNYGNKIPVLQSTEIVTSMYLFW